MNPFGYVLTAGVVSPFELSVRRGEIAAALSVGISVPVVVIAIDQPTDYDLDVFKFGRFDIALEHEGTTAFLLWRFCRPGGSPHVVDTPFHAALEDIDISDWAEAKVLGDLLFGIVVQDETGLIHYHARFRLPELIANHLSRMAERQLAERHGPGFPQSYWDDNRRFGGQPQSLSKTFAAAKIKASVR